MHGERMLERATSWVTAACLIGAALVLSWPATRGLSWPIEIDLYRDMGAAQALLEGDWSGDPAYLGERRWYPPLVPMLCAAVSALFDIPLRTVFSHAGLWLNLLGPVAFFGLVRSWFGPRAACFALLGFLFLRGSSVPSTHVASYSPWLWPFNFTQGLTYLTLGALVQAERRRHVLVELLSGILLGLTFLSHPAPALVIAVAWLAHLGWRLSDERQPRPAVVSLLSVAVPAFLLALYALWPIASEYGFRTLNTSPARHIAVSNGQIAKLLVFSISAVGALVCLAALCFPRRLALPSRASRLAMTATGSAALLLIYGIASQSLHARGVDLPAAVPAFHFNLVLSALLTAWFGLGVDKLLELLGQRIRGLSSGRLGVLSLAIIASVAAARAPSYQARHELQHQRSESQRLAARSDLTGLYQFALSVPPDSVFAADVELSTFAVAGAGRKAICVNENHSNPYVSWTERCRAQAALMTALERGDIAVARRVSAAYALRFVVFSAEGASKSPLPLDAVRKRATQTFPGARVFQLAEGALTLIELPMSGARGIR
jgi:hypothetical protein